MMPRPLIIAIDGPSGAGKGTISRTIADRLGYRYIDTGAMYRAVAWLARHEGLNLHDGGAVAELAERAEFDLGGRTLIDDYDVTAAIRTPAIDEASAIVARQAEVRAVLVDRQRKFGRSGGLVMEGRDIGTVVFPDADVKIYLDASPEERARRRAGDPAHAARREPARVDDVAQALQARDYSDRTRSASPLLRAADAIYIDTTGMPVEQVVREVLSVVDAAMARQLSS